MQLKQARKYLQAIPRFSAAVCFTGGEPMLFYEEIAELISEAKSSGLRVTLFTGAGWVNGEAMARKRLQTLDEAGLDEISISWDDFHQEFSPPERAVMLARIATEANLPVTIRTVVASNRPAVESQSVFKNLPVRIETPPVARLGRAISLPASDFFQTKTPPKEFCTNIFTPVIEPDGAVYACCGPAHFSERHSPLVLGNAQVEPLEEILARAAQDPVLEALRWSGPYGLYTLLQGHPVGREKFNARSIYTGMCELCQDITNDPELVSALQERLKDHDAQIFLMASRLWAEKKLAPDLKKLRSNMSTQE